MNKGGRSPASAAYALPANLAYEAAQAAVEACARQGYRITATVVDDHGLPVAFGNKANHVLCHLFFN